MRIDIEIPENAAPGRFGVYVLLDDKDQILYIGQTRDLYARLRSHRNGKSWWSEVRRLEWTPCDGPLEARVAEKGLIALFRPQANQMDRKALFEQGHQRLPEECIARLVELHEAAVVARDMEANRVLNEYIRALREAGWTLHSIARPIGMTRERVRQRQACADRAAEVAVPTAPPRPKKVREVKVKPSIPGEDLEELLRLKPMAMRVRGLTPLDSPNRVASERFSELLAEHYLNGVSIHRMAQQLGFTDLAVRARLARHGYMEPVKGLPDNVPYGTPHPKRGLQGACQAGHPLEGDNLRLVNGDPKRRICRTCEKRRADEYRDRKRQAGVA